MSAWEKFGLGTMITGLYAASVAMAATEPNWLEIFYKWTFGGRP